jgi:FG-GAP repeat protein
MFNLYIKINEKRVLSAILADLILFPLLLSGLSTTITTYAEVVSKDEGPSSNVTSLDTITLDTITLGKIKKNTTDMMNQDNNSNKMTKIESTINDTIISKNLDKNEISFPFNITNAIGSTTTSNAATQGSEVTADFNGDGFEDKAVGVPYEHIGSIVYAGLVHVIYGSSPAGLSPTAVLPDQLWTQDSSGIEDFSEADDNFGGVSSGDYNGDGSDDLAIGVQGEDIGSIVNAGAVHIIYGSSPAGLSATAVLSDQLWTQDSDFIEESAEADDSFGSSL